MTIRNMKDLEKALQPVMLGMADKLAERVYETLNYFLQEYYNSYDPKSYSRQFDFLRSAVKVEPKVIGNKVTAAVFIDEDYMDNYYTTILQSRYKLKRLARNGKFVNTEWVLVNYSPSYNIYVR